MEAQDGTNLKCFFVKQVAKTLFPDYTQETPP